MYPKQAALRNKRFLMYAACVKSAKAANEGRKKSGRICRGLLRKPRAAIEGMILARVWILRSRADLLRLLLMDSGRSRR
jgi:hypothetical protein